MLDKCTSQVENKKEISEISDNRRNNNECNDNDKKAGSKSMSELCSFALKAADLSSIPSGTNVSPSSSNCSEFAWQRYPADIRLENSSGLPNRYFDITYLL